MAIVNPKCEVCGDEALNRWFDPDCEVMVVASLAIAPSLMTYFENRSQVSKEILT
jgi:hypothetical protein